MYQIPLLIALSISYNLSAMDTINSLTLEEKIGQMCVVATMANPARNPEFVQKCLYSLDPSYAKKMIDKHQIGGIIFLGASTPEEQVVLANELQQQSRSPLLIFLDAEWGLSMRMAEGVTVYPKAMTLGALSDQDDQLIYQLGYEIGTQCRAIGVHSSLSPVCDVNNNPQNPIINMRSFGQNPALVAKKALLFMHGLQKANTLGCAKHAPGHGDTATDSHHQLPVIRHKRERLNEIELHPFTQLIAQGIDAIMTAHLDVPELTGKEGLPASLSKKVVTDLFRKEMGFDGLIITDGLGMKGLTDQLSHDEIAVQTVKAGTDILLCPVDVSGAIEALKNAVTTGEISEKEIDEHVERILNAKKRTKIERCITLLKEKLVSPEAHNLKKDLYRAAITLARNDHNRLPLKPNETIAIVTISDEQHEIPFVEKLKLCLNTTCHTLSTKATRAECDQLYENLQNTAHIIINVHLPSRSGMIEMESETINQKPPSYVSLINALGKKATLILFGNPYNLAQMPNSGATILAYENEPEAQVAAAETIMGTHFPRGQLPVTACDEYKEGTSLRY